MTDDERQVTDAPVQAGPESRYGEGRTMPDTDNPNKPESPGRADEAQDPDREGGVGPPDKASQDLPDAPEGTPKSEAIEEGAPDSSGTPEPEAG